MGIVARLRQACSGAEPVGHVVTGGRRVPRIAARWSARDWMGALRARVGIMRHSYRVEAGLYALGNPGPQDPVLATACYKLSFDHVRRALRGRDAWILVLETKGINVWCAAGKGTFGTDELVRRLGESGLEDIVSHRRVVVPQLGAPGVEAPRVKSESGFEVIYGPIRARDLPEYLDAGMEAAPEMRSVTFSASERLVLTPVEVKQGLKYAAGLFALLAAGAAPGGADAMLNRLPAAGLLAGSGLGGGAVLTPALLPWLPGRAFALKGGSVGLLLGALCWFGAGSGAGLDGAVGAAACLLMAGALSAFLGMKFTGSTPYTSLSGVEKEVRRALPVQIGACALGVVLWLLTCII